MPGLPCVVSVNLVSDTLMLASAPSLGVGGTEKRQQQEVELMLGLSWCAGLGQGRPFSSGWATCVLAWWCLRSPFSPSGTPRRSFQASSSLRETVSRDCGLCRSVLRYQLVHYPAKVMPVHVSKNLFSLKASYIAQISAASPQA